MSESIKYWLAMSMVANFGYRAYQKLKEQLKMPEELFQLSKKALENLPLTSKQVESISSLDWSLIDRKAELIDSSSEISFLSIADGQYPAQLREISAPPLVLYLKGDQKVLAKSQIAIVGSRNATEEGKHLAYSYASALAENGFCVTSGAAVGIDGSAHRGALCQGETVAVLGCGFDHTYPKCHKQLLEEIESTGCVVSEYFPDTPPKPALFPRRNRIISGLSLGVLVVEAAVKSGSLITAYMALEQNREVFAVPGSIHHPLARGCHSLIRQGAKLVEQVADIIEELPPVIAQEDVVVLSETLSTNEQSVFNCVGYIPCGIDQIIVDSGLSAAQVTPILTQLEIEGHVVAVPGGYKKVIRTNHERTRT